MATTLSGLVSDTPDGWFVKDSRWLRWLRHSVNLGKTSKEIIGCCLSPARFGDPIVSPPPYQFAIDSSRQLWSGEFLR